MIDLTARQVQILRAVIEEFISTAEPVGSETVDKKYAIGVSPATIRNEMAHLTKQGYLTKSHSSAGRVPTSVAMKLYVNELMKEKDLSVADEVDAKEKIWNSRDKLDQMLYQITKVLADKSNALALSLHDENQLHHSGYANLLQMPEFYDIKVMRHVLLLIEQDRMLEEIFGTTTNENLVQVVYGTELGNHNLDSIGIIYMSFKVDGQPVHIALLGSSRFDYAYIIPMMKYIRGLIKEIIE